MRDLEMAESVGNPCEKLIARGILCGFKGDTEGSLDGYKNAMKMYPSNGMGYFWAGMASSDEDRSGLFQRAIELNYMPHECHYQIGSQCLRSDNPVEETQSQQDAKCTNAIPDFKACLQGNPYRTVCHIELGFAQLQLNHVEDAKRCFDKAVDLNPALSDSYAGLAVIYKHEGNKLRERQYWEQYLTSLQPRKGTGNSGSGISASDIDKLLEDMTLADGDKKMRPPNEEIVRVYVARRQLYAFLLPKYWLLAHSAVILKTKSQKHYLLEYMGDSNVHLREIEYTVKRTQEKGKPHQVITVGADVWTKQLHGKAPPSVWTLQQAKDKMEELMSDKKYNLLSFHVCHKAQEQLRAAMGIFP